jgi:hypothetical protein
MSPPDAVAPAAASCTTPLFTMARRPGRKTLSQLASAHRMFILVPDAAPCTTGKPSTPWLPTLTSS